MKKKILLLFFIFLFISYCSITEDEQSEENGVEEGNYKIFGYVFKFSDFSKLSAVKVKLLENNSESTTDNSGRYEIGVDKTGEYTLVIENNNYNKEYIKINVTNRTYSRKDFYLIPKLNGNTYYVSPDGNDNNSGSESSPWRSPAYASRKLSPGDTLIIKSGTYEIHTYGEDIITPPSGNSNNWIVIKGEDGIMPVLKGYDNLSYAIDLSNSSYIKIENLEITNLNKKNFREGISIVGNRVNSVILNNVYIHHLDEFGIDMQDVDRMVIINSRIEYCGFGSIGGPSPDSCGLINLMIVSTSLSYSGHYYQGGDGSNRPYDRPDGFGIEQSAGPIEIYDCVVEHNYGDGIDSKSSDTYVHHCIVANNSCDGIKLWHGDSKIENCLIYGTGDGIGGSSPWAGIVLGSDRTGDKFEIINTTLHDNSQREAYPMYVQYDDDKVINVYIYNSIFSGGFGHLWFRENVNLTFENSIIYIPSRDDQVYANGRLYSVDDINNGVLGKNNIYADPQFEDPQWGKTGNYRLKDGSPAIDKANNSKSPSDDLDHNKRLVNDTSDIGAYEKQN